MIICQLKVTPAVVVQYRLGSTNCFTVDPPLTHANVVTTRPFRLVLIVFMDNCRDMVKYFHQIGLLQMGCLGICCYGSDWGNFSGGIV